LSQFCACTMKSSPQTAKNCIVFVMFLT